MSVTPNNIAAFIGLEIPGRNDNNVTFAYPNAAFHLASYAAESFHAILAFDHDAVVSEEFCDYA
jgi:hypothetical protein